MTVSFSFFFLFPNLHAGVSMSLALSPTAYDFTSSLLLLLLIELKKGQNPTAADTRGIVFFFFFFLLDVFSLRHVAIDITNGTAFFTHDI